ncbi:MAG TPA: alcohol dehydrogenase catalytic domain-containing protein [Paracoccus sp. (in: a-proteobacteria)]|nr:alcohol dehydrogenase catalytic domain-containing protein [Paracoccus sp. (in: a-proteobacteria)]
MVFTGGWSRLELRDLPQPAPGEVLIRVEACGVCRADLHIVDGELAGPRLPLVPGHEIVGRVECAGPRVKGLPTGQRVGVPWLGTHADAVLTVQWRRKTSATHRSSPVTPATAAMPNTASRTRPMSFPCP